MNNKEYVIGIDIGSSNVVMAVGERNENGELKVLGVDVQNVESAVNDGEIINAMELGKAIVKAKSALEAELGLQLNSAYVGVSGRSVYCVRYEDHVDINVRTGCVTDVEMRELNSRIGMVVSAGGDIIIQRIPLRYTIDGNREVQNPLGAFGRKLTATYLLVFISGYLEDRVNRVMHYADMRVSGLCVSPTLLPEVLLTPYEEEEGVAIVDIGSNLTDIAVVREKKLWHFASLPIGASSINSDLYEFLKISKKEVNQIKHKYGAAIASDVSESTAISVKTAGHAKKQILQRNIAEIAEERLKDIAQFVMRELKSAKFSTKVPCGVVLTGGSAYLDGIDRLFARELNMEVRLGNALNGLDSESQDSVSAFPQSVVIGLLLYGFKHQACNVVSNVPIERVDGPAPGPVVTEQHKLPIEQESQVLKTPTPSPVVEETNKPKETEVVTPTEKPSVKPEEESVGNGVDDTEEDDDVKNNGTDDEETYNGDNNDGDANTGGRRNWLDKLKDKIDHIFESPNNDLL